MNDDDNLRDLLSKLSSENLNSEYISYLYNKSRDLLTFQQIKRLILKDERSDLILNLMLFIKKLILSNIEKIRIENISEIYNFLIQYTKRNFEFLSDNRVSLNQCLVILSMCVKKLIDYDKLVLVKEILNDIKEFNVLLLFDFLRELFNSSFRDCRDTKELNILFSPYIDEAFRIILEQDNTYVTSLTVSYIRNLLYSFSIDRIDHQTEDDDVKHLTCSFEVNHQLQFIGVLLDLFFKTEDLNIANNILQIILYMLSYEVLTREQISAYSYIIFGYVQDFFDYSLRCENIDISHNISRLIYKLYLININDINKSMEEIHSNLYNHIFLILESNNYLQLPDIYVNYLRCLTLIKNNTSYDMIFTILTKYFDLIVTNHSFLMEQNDYSYIYIFSKYENLCIRLFDYVLDFVELDALFESSMTDNKTELCISTCFITIASLLTTSNIKKDESLIFEVYCRIINILNSYIMLSSPFINEYSLNTSNHYIEHAFLLIIKNLDKIFESSYNALSSTICKKIGISYNNLINMYFDRLLLDLDTFYSDTHVIKRVISILNMRIFKEFLRLNIDQRNMLIYFRNPNEHLFLQHIPNISYIEEFLCFINKLMLEDQEKESKIRDTILLYQQYCESLFEEFEEKKVILLLVSLKALFNKCTVNIAIDYSILFSIFRKKMLENIFQCFNLINTHELMCFFLDFWISVISSRSRIVFDKFSHDGLIIFYNSYKTIFTSMKLFLKSYNLDNKHILMDMYKKILNICNETLESNYIPFSAIKFYKKGDIHNLIDEIFVSFAEERFYSYMEFFDIVNYILCFMNIIIREHFELFKDNYNMLNQIITYLSIITTNSSALIKNKSANNSTSPIETMYFLVSNITDYKIDINTIETPIFNAFVNFWHTLFTYGSFSQKNIISLIKLSRLIPDKFYLILTKINENQPDNSSIKLYSDILVQIVIHEQQTHRTAEVLTKLKDFLEENSVRIM